MSSDNLEAAIKAIQSSDKQNGRRLLTIVLNNDPHNETAWLWLAKIVENENQRQDCLNRVLKINPNNQVAQRELGLIGQDYSPPNSKQVQMVSKQPYKNVLAADRLATHHQPSPKNHQVLFFIVSGLILKSENYCSKDDKKDKRI